LARFALFASSFAIMIRGDRPRYFPPSSVVRSTDLHPRRRLRQQPHVLVDLLRVRQLVGARRCRREQPWGRIPFAAACSRPEAEENFRVYSRIFAVYAESIGCLGSRPDGRRQVGLGMPATNGAAVSRTSMRGNAKVAAWAIVGEEVAEPQSMKVRRESDQVKRGANWSAIARDRRVHLCESRQCSPSDSAFHPHLQLSSMTSASRPHSARPVHPERREEASHRFLPF